MTILCHCPSATDITAIVSSRHLRSSVVKAPVRSPRGGQGAQASKMFRKRWALLNDSKSEGEDEPLAIITSPTQILKKDGYKKGLFTPDEDAKIIDCIKRGIRDFRVISSFVADRSAKQVKDRYEHSLDPTLERGPWSYEEDCLLVREQLKHGNVWKQVSKVHIPRRSDNAIKNRFHSVNFKTTIRDYASALANDPCASDADSSAQQAALATALGVSNDSFSGTTDSGKSWYSSISGKSYADTSSIDFELFQITVTDSYKSNAAADSSDNNMEDDDYPVMSDHRTYTDASASSSVKDFDAVFNMNEDTPASSRNNTTTKNAARFFSISDDTRTSIKFLSSLSLDSTFDNQFSKPNSDTSSPWESSSEKYMRK